MLFSRSLALASTVALAAAAEQTSSGVGSQVKWRLGERLGSLRLDEHKCKRRANRDLGCRERLLEDVAVVREQRSPEEDINTVQAPIVATVHDPGLDFFLDRSRSRSTCSHAKSSNASSSATVGCAR
jgi:hypothetical protein